MRCDRHTLRDAWFKTLWMVYPQEQRAVCKVLQLDGENFSSIHAMVDFHRQEAECLAYRGMVALQVPHIKKIEGCMKTYSGIRTEVGPIVTVTEGSTSKRLQHIRLHSPDGFEWGYGGSGPSDLALSILRDHLGYMPDPNLYMDFKFQFVANWRNDYWKITGREIDEWIMKRGNRE